MQRQYRVHQAATVSVETARRIYRRHCVEMEAPKYSERCVVRQRIVERARLVAPGYVMVPADASVTPGEINEEAGRAIVYRSIGTLDAGAIDRMKATPLDDKVPTKRTIKKGSRVKSMTLGMTGTALRNKSGRVEVVLDGKFAGTGTVSIPVADIEVIDDSTAAQLHPGS